MMQATGLRDGDKLRVDSANASDESLARLGIPRMSRTDFAYTEPVERERRESASRKHGLAACRGLRHFHPSRHPRAL
jgi:hypothetical protein